MPYTALLLFVYAKKSDQCFKQVSSHPCLAPKGNLHLGANVIQQLSAPFPLPWLPVKGSSCSQFLLPWDFRRLPLPAQGAEPAQRAARAGVNAGREK